MMRKLSSQTLPWPVDWCDLFGTQRLLILEIGFGYATYLVHLAQTHPEANIVGIEIANECLLRGEKAITRHKLDNLRVIHSTAETALHHLFEPQSISQIHINFPDPWFKKKHGHRRLMKRETLDAISSRLAPGGHLYLATDIVEYAEMSAVLLAQTPSLTNLLDSTWVHDVPGRFMTKYERKARAAGRLCYYFVYQRNTQPAPVVPVIKESPMPHIVFTSPLSLDALTAHFRPSENPVDDMHISFIQVYTAQDKDTALYDVFVKEPTIDQRVVLLLIKRRLSDEYTIKLGTIGHPRPTAGIHKAVALLGQQLMRLHPDSQPIKAKVQREE